MPRTRSILAALALSLLLAGCGEPAPAADSPPTAAPDDPAPPPRGSDPPLAGPVTEGAVGAPAWSPGDWWRWRVEPQEADPFEVTTVIAAREGDAFLLGVDDLTLGLHAFADHAIMLGRVDAATLAWEVHDAPARILAFPLFDGASWEGTEEGRALRFQASRARAMGPDGEVEVYEAVGMADGAPGVAFTYAPSAGHFLRYAVHYGGEEPYVTATLVAHGRGAASAWVVESDDAFFAFAAAPRPGDPEPPVGPQRFEVPTGATHLLLACWGGGQGMQRALAQPPAGPPAACERRGLGGTGNASFHAALVPAVPGTWTALAFAAGGYLEAEGYALRVAETTVRA